MDRQPPDDWAARRALGVGVRSARRLKGWSQRELGERARLSQSAVSRLETGTVNGLRYQTLVRVLEVLETREVELVTRRRTWFGGEHPDSI
jgi:transcriptional regulator with XRE-family HTH domain